jgi:hypothetical protein
MKASQYFKKKMVNMLNYEWNPDGSVTITIFKEGWRRPCKFKVKNLYQENEVILEDEEVMD